MAGDWIKLEKSTARKPEVLRIAVALGIHPDHAFGLCMRFWSWCDDQLIDGNAAGVTESLLDTVLERQGFASALISVGWLQARNGSLVVPNFDRHLSESAKTRALTARRVAKHKRKSGNASGVTSALPREEKRREDGNTHTHTRGNPDDGNKKAKEVSQLIFPKSLDTELVRDAVVRWCEYWFVTQGRRAAAQSIQAALANVTREKWSPEKLVQAIDFSMSVNAKRWLDPADDWSKRREKPGRSDPPADETPDDWLKSVKEAEKRAKQRV